MSNETPRAPDPATSSEWLINQDRIGFYSRFLLGSAFHTPMNDIPLGTEVAITPFAKRNYEAVQNLSTYTCKARWEAIVPSTADKVGDFNRRYAIWGPGALAVMQTPEAEAYLRDLHFLEADEIGVKDGKISEGQLRALFDKYKRINPNLDGTALQGVKLFMADGIDSFFTANPAATQEDFNTYKERLLWLAHGLFDEGADEMIDWLSDFEIGLIHPNSTLTEDIKTAVRTGRANSANLSQQEIKHLETLYILNKKELYPVWEKAQEIIRVLGVKNGFSALYAPTGGGKTTQLFQIIDLLLRNQLKPGDRVEYSEPTKANTSQIPLHIARETPYDIGKQISWKHGDDEVPVENPDDEKLAIMTEGIMVLRLMQVLTDYHNAPYKEGQTYYLILDEAHIQSENLETIIFLGEQIHAKHPKLDIRMMIATATGNKELYGENGRLGIPNNMTVEATGKRRFDITTQYLPEHIEEDQIVPFMLEYFRNITTETKADGTVVAREKHKDYGHIIAFLKSRNAIRTLGRLLKNDEQARRIPILERLTYHSKSDPADIEAAKQLTKESDPHEILATDAIMTGITLDGATHGLISGQRYTNEYNDTTGFSEVIEELLAKDEIQQMLGRLARVAPGWGGVMMTKNEYEARPDHSRKELERVSLARFVLRMKNIGIKEPRKAKMLTDLSTVAPPNATPEQIKRAAFNEARFKEADETLVMLGAQDAITGEITDLGRRMVMMPVELHNARALAEAEDRRMDGPVIDTICMAEAYRHLYKDFEEGEEHEAENAKIARLSLTVEFSDPLTLYNTLSSYLHYTSETDDKGLPRHPNSVQALKERWCSHFGINLKTMEDVVKRIQKIKKSRTVRGDGHADAAIIEECFVKAYEGNLLQWNPLTNSFMMLHNNHPHVGLDKVAISDESIVKPPSTTVPYTYMVTGDVSRRAGTGDQTTDVISANLNQIVRDARWLTIPIRPKKPRNQPQP